MTLGLAFWVLMLLWLVFGFWSNWPSTGSPLKPLGGTLLLFILLALLGWAQFGAPLHK